jgi:predicted lipid-binding transport protein (Tim44 family)
VQLAAAEATEDDAWFDPDAVKAETAELYRQVQRAWDARDDDALARHLGQDLLVEWRRRLADFRRKGWHNRVEIMGDVQVEYLGLVNREDDDEDRVTVRVTATLRDYVVNKHGQRITHKGTTSEMTHQAEWWICVRTADGWKLESIEQDKEGQHLLDEQLVASPWSDEQGLRDEALVEGAQADAVPEGTSVAEVADLDFEGDARAAANDLSLADGRFAPDILEVAVRRATAAWARAVDGDDAPLAAVARPDALHALLYPRGDNSRLVVRGPRVTQMTVVALDAGATPPTMTVRVDLAGRRYVENRDTLAKISGSADRERTWSETWTLALDGDAANPWRIAATTDAPAPAGA